MFRAGKAGDIQYTGPRIWAPAPNGGVRHDMNPAADPFMFATVSHDIQRYRRAIRVQLKPLSRRSGSLQLCESPLSTSHRYIPMRVQDSSPVQGTAVVVLPKP